MSVRNGSTTYSHTAITPTIVTPGSNRVISLSRQYIEPQDGVEKQDCENTAGKRWLAGQFIAAELLIRPPPIGSVLTSR